MERNNYISYTMFACFALVRLDKEQLNFVLENQMILKLILFLLFYLNFAFALNQTLAKDLKVIHNSQDFHPITSYHNAHNKNQTCQKIITLTPELTELVASLLPSSSIVATDLYSNFPPYVKTLPKIADFYHINFEKLLTIDYDCIFIGQEFNSVTINQIKNRIKKRVEVFHIQTITDLIQSSKTIINLTHQNQELSSKLESSLKLTMQQIKSKYSAVKDNENKQVAFVIWPKPLIVAANNNYLTELASLCGFQNAFADLKGFPSISIEQIYLRKTTHIINLGNNLTGVKLPSNVTQIDYPQKDLLLRLTPRTITEGLPILCNLLRSKI